MIPFFYNYNPLCNAEETHLCCLENQQSVRRFPKMSSVSSWCFYDFKIVSSCSYILSKKK